MLTAGASADAMLAEMARMFHQASALSALKVAPADDPGGAIAAMAQTMSAELLQLNYQIAVLGRRDLGLAPDERTGLEMTLLRLLAFQPEAAGSAQPAVRSAALKAPMRPQATVAALPSASLTPEQWPTISRTLSVSGLARQFVQQAQLMHCHDAGRTVQCRFRVPIPALAEGAVIAKVQDALTGYFGKPCKLETEVGEAAELTAAAQDADAAAQAQAKAEQAIESDPLVQSILKDFGGKIVPGSIRPKGK
jgi:DNA polymerase-3 subunit gamma/tau